MSKTALYRHFDHQGTLLYVGISSRAFRRTCEHQSSSQWFKLVTRIDIEWFDRRLDAEAAEYRTIRSEKPLFNRAFNFRPPAPAQPFVVLDKHMKPLQPEMRTNPVEINIKPEPDKPLSKRQMYLIRQANVALRRGLN